MVSPLSVGAVQSICTLVPTKDVVGALGVSGSTAHFILLIGEYVDQPKILLTLYLN